MSTTEEDLALDNNGAPTGPTDDVEDVVDGPGSGGGPGGGGGGGGGFSSGDPLAGFRSLLLRMRIPPGPFIGLMQQAAQQNWTADEFMWSLESNPRFQKMFPGINALLDQGMSLTSAVGEWRQLYTLYREEAQDAGLMRFAKLTPRRFGMYLEEGVDVEEMLFRVSIIKMAKTSEPFRNAFNAILKQKGQRQLDKQGWANFLAGKGEAALYDLYEGVLLLQELGGEGLKVKEARRLAKMVSGPEGGPAFTPAGFAEAITHIQRTLGTQLLDDAGLDPKKLALATLKDAVGSPEARRRAATAFDSLEQLMKNQAAAAREGGREATSSLAGRPISELAPQ